ncbi:TMEM43 family protein [Rhodanobacter sp. FW102-FHT14D06]|uniref:TMEM43 family protein n=2 Tax=unclassified Rhodanobacter TaxID=2621553 RepID=A0AB74URS5_9GAMM
MELGKGMSWRLLALNVIGALLVIAGIGLEALNASSLIDFRQASVRHGGEAIELGADALPQPGQHGYMARLAGTPRVVEAPHDPEFNQTANTPVLVRHVEMFQWREISIGGSVHYELDWVDQPVDSSRFRYVRGHVNPGRFPIESKQFDAGLVQMGGFRLGRVLVHALPGSELIEPDPAALPQNLAVTFSRYQDYLVTSAHPGDPRLGDLRVSWSAVPLQQVTIVARLDGARLEAAADAPDGKGYQVQVGDVPLLALFPDLPVPPQYVMLWRVLSVLLAALGALALLAAQGRRRDPLLALGLGSIGVGAVASVLWLGGENAHVLGGWVVVTLVGVALSVWCLRRQDH